MVISHIDENGVAHMLGFGTFDGEHPIGAEAVGCIAAQCRARGRVNPRITLESGDVVWGAECWFGTEQAIRRTLEEGRVQGTVNEDIKALREKAQKCLVVKFFVPPNREIHWIPVIVDNDTFNKMGTLSEMGFHLEGEHLRLVGKMSVTLTSRDHDEEIELTNNADDYAQCVEKVVSDGYNRLVVSKLA